MSGRAKTLWLMQASVFLGSFLLFCVQPMMSRTLLPSFGGSAAVWTICLATYQVLLLVGYSYAHLLSRMSGPRQRGLHRGLLGAAVVWTALLAVTRVWFRDHLGNTGVPSLEVLLFVSLAVGLPYVLLAAGSTLLQVWASGMYQGTGVYRLYAISNLGSFLGLLTYPLLMEPFVSLNGQWFGWGAGLALYIGLVYMVTRGGPALDRLDHGQAKQSDGQNTPPESGRLPQTLMRPWLWLVLPAASSFLLVATTNHLSLEVTPIPLLWVTLLGLFLLSYVLGFSRAGEVALPVWLSLAVVVTSACVFYGDKGGPDAFIANLALGGGLVLFGGAFVHGWLYATRPTPARLTHYYLGVAAGGAIGGTLASLIAPVCFDRVMEYPVALILLAALAAWFTRRLNHPELRGLNQVFLILCISAPMVIGWHMVQEGKQTLFRARSFYGTLKVLTVELKMRSGNVWPEHWMVHNGTMHGRQVIHPQMGRLPTSYFGPNAGGLAVLNHPRYAANQAMRVGDVGLGVGTMSTYGRTNDFYRFYEINAQVVEMARNTNLFSYLSDCPARVEIALGDARKSLVKEIAAGEPRYDVLLVDAYNGDGVPIHLATREAFQIYFARLAPDGILAINVTNWHIDLLPLCKAVGKELGVECRGFLSFGDKNKRTEDAAWVLMSKTPLIFDAPPSESALEVDWGGVADIALPTDEKGSLLGLVRLGLRPAVKMPATSVDMMK